MYSNTTQQHSSAYNTTLLLDGWTATTFEQCIEQYPITVHSSTAVRSASKSGVAGQCTTPPRAVYRDVFKLMIVRATNTPTNQLLCIIPANQLLCIMPHGYNRPCCFSFLASRMRYILCLFLCRVFIFLRPLPLCALTTIILLILYLYMQCTPILYRLAARPSGGVRPGSSDSDPVGHSPQLRQAKEGARLTNWVRSSSASAMSGFVFVECVQHCRSRKRPLC